MQSRKGCWIRIIVDRLRVCLGKGGWGLGCGGKKFWWGCGGRGGRGVGSIFSIQYESVTKQISSKSLMTKHESRSV
jgi:hypothetical protein